MTTAKTTVSPAEAVRRSAAAGTAGARAARESPKPPTAAAAQQATEAATARAEGKVQPNRQPRPRATSPGTPARQRQTAAARKQAESVTAGQAQPKAEAKATPKAKAFDYAYVLEAGSGVFSVHKPGCRDLAKVSTDYAQPALGTAASYAEMLRDLWGDQIRESDTPVPERTDEWVEGNYGSEVSVAPCLRLPGVKAEPRAKAAADAKRDAKRALATRVVRAAAALNGLTDEEKRTIAHWLHHLPADREAWVAAGLPKPDRSDWR